MNRKFITIWLLMVLCTAEPIHIKLTDTFKDICPSWKLSPTLTPHMRYDLNIDNVICPESLPIYCKSTNTNRKMTRCLAEKYFKSWNQDTRQEFIIESEKDKVFTCQSAKNLLDLTRHEFYLMGEFKDQKISSDSHETAKGKYQCILIGHQYGNSVKEILYYTVPDMDNSIAKGVENKTGFQKFDRPGQIHYDFFSCSATKEGIMNAKEWYEKQKPWYQIWNEKVKQWYENYRNTYKFWVVILICIVVLFGVIGLCVYYCCGNYHAKQTEEGDTEFVVNDSSDHSVSSSNFVIELSELLRMQSTLTSTTDKYSVETMNSITSTTDPKQSHSTEDLSFSSEVELTKEMKDSEDSNNSESETKEEISDDMHRSQSNHEAQKSEKKYHFNSESDFSI